MVNVYENRNLLISNNTIVIVDGVKHVPIKTNIIQDGAVTTNKIADGAVTLEKLSADIPIGKITSSVITTSDDLGCFNYQKPISDINHLIIYG